MGHARSAAELERLSPRERQTVIAFGSTVPGILAHPYFIARHGTAALLSVQECTGAALGIWGEVPLVGLKGEVFEEPADGNLSRLFGSWVHPLNQEELAAYASHRRNTSKFTMLIPASTVPSLLGDMYAEVSRVDLDDYYHYIEILGEWLDGLGWAYVPLPEDNEFALFVSGATQGSLTEDVASTLRQRGERPFRLERTSAGFLW